MKVLKTYKLYLDGKFPRSESGRYYAVKAKNVHVANVCQSSRKDFREAVVSSRSALGGWANRSAYNRGQILYRIAEILEGRKGQFIEELEMQGYSKGNAQNEVHFSIDRLVSESVSRQNIFSIIFIFHKMLPLRGGNSNPWCPQPNL